MDGFGMSDDPSNAAAAAADDFDHAFMSSFLNSGISTSLHPHETQSMLHFKNAFRSHLPMHQEQRPQAFGIELTDNESDDSTTADGERPQNGCRKRLSVDQVHCLEKSFKVDSKLEPRRKGELARELGLKPRQVAIWFQNRRARHKNKQIEKEYDKIAAQYGMIKAQYDKVINENKKLKAQMKSMKDEMSLMRDSLSNYAKLTQAGLLDAHVMQPQVQAEPQLMQQIQPEAYNNPSDFNNVCNGAMTEQQLHQVLSPASSVFDSNSPVVKPNSSKLVNQELHYDLPNLFGLDEPNCFYSSQVDGPPFSPCHFGLTPAADDPFWQFEL